MDKFLTIIVMLAFTSVGLAQKVYKWVDENGQIHYASKKPLDQQAETVKIRKGPTVVELTEDEKAALQKQALSAEEAEANAEEDEQAKLELAAIDKANNLKLCQQAKKNLAALNATPRVTQIDQETGNIIRLNDDQRIQALKNAKKNISESCR